jgi:hypothetical protein
MKFPSFYLILIFLKQLPFKKEKIQQFCKVGRQQSLAEFLELTQPSSNPCVSKRQHSRKKRFQLRLRWCNSTNLSSHHEERNKITLQGSCPGNPSPSHPFELSREWNLGPGEVGEHGWRIIPLPKKTSQVCYFLPIINTSFTFCWPQYNKLLFYTSPCVP